MLFKKIQVERKLRNMYVSIYNRYMQNPEKGIRSEPKVIGSCEVSAWVLGTDLQRLSARAASILNC